MGLFTDGPPCTMEDLSAQDSQLLTVANSEGIDVTQKLALAHEELGLDLYSLLTRMSYVDQLFWLSPKPNLATVGVTPPLKLWHAFRTLEMVYADAYNNQLNDRYAGKRDQFHERARWAYDKLVENGLGIVQLPVGKARTPMVSTIPGAIPDGTYYVTMAWENDQGEEGASADAAVAATISSSLQVQAVTPAPLNATGWNVYLGPAPDQLILQNAVPLPIDSAWTQPNTVITVGKKPGNGQKPTYIQPIPRVIQRG